MKIRNINRSGSLIAAAAITALLAGCSSTDEELVQNLSDTSTTTAPVSQGPSQAELDAQRLRDQMLAVTVFYFDFDKSDLKPEAMEALRFHAERLKSNASMHVRLEGHADERGTPEYNLALGQYWRRGTGHHRSFPVQPFYDHSPAAQT